MNDNTIDWVAWHSPYSDPQSALSRRLEIIQSHIKSCLLAQLTYSRQVISLCAGQGRDLLDVLERTPQLREARALLIESDPENVKVASDRIQQMALANVAVHCADAGNSDSYVGATPADLVLLCGVFGNICDPDIFNTIKFLPRMCAADATVIWTRSRRDPDITPAIRRSFEANGFLELAFIAPSDEKFSVGVNKLSGTPEQLTSNEQLFTFL